MIETPRMNHSRRRDKLGPDQKSKSKKVSTKPNYSINGRTYACESCKIGHRVSKCTHAHTRPVLMTNDPGRPSADQKRHCECPRQCSCTGKCKCDRNCTCTQTRYMLVYVPVGNEYGQEEEEHGEWKVDREIITDMKGNPLSVEEIQKRAVERASRGNSRNGRTNIFGLGLRNTPASSADNTSSSARLDTNDESAVTPDRSCCKHRKNMQPMPEAQTEVNKDKEPSQAATSTRPRCNCGPDCICPFCLEHPNNKESHRMVQQQAAQFAHTTSNSQPQTVAIKSSQGYESCMGTNPQFAWHSGPNPSMSDLQNMFGSRAGQGYLLQYPVRPFSTLPTVDEGRSRSSGTSIPQPTRLDQSRDQSEPPLTKMPDNLPDLSSPTAATFGDYLTQDQLFDLPMSSNQKYLTSNMSSPDAFPDAFVGQGTIAGVYGIGDDWTTPADMSAVQHPPNWFSTQGLSSYGYGNNTNGTGDESLQHHLGLLPAVSARNNFSSSAGEFAFDSQPQAPEFFHEPSTHATYEWPVASPHGIFQNHHQPTLLGPSLDASDTTHPSVVQPNLTYTNGATGYTKAITRAGTSNGPAPSGSVSSSSLST